MNLLCHGLDRRISVSRTHSRSGCVHHFPPLIRDQFVTKKAEETRQSERFISLSLISSVYGIGPVTARKLYDLGLRTMRDVEAYYEVNTGFTPVEQTNSAEMDVRIALELHDDLMQTCDLTRYRDEMLTFAQHSP
jgi:Fingers domain of DNA polymerase lambda